MTNVSLCYSRVDFNDRVDIKPSLCGRLQALGYIALDVLKRVTDTFDATKISRHWNGPGKNHTELEKHIRKSLQDKFGHVAGDRANDIIHALYQMDLGEAGYDSSWSGYVVAGQWELGRRATSMDEVARKRKKALGMVMHLMEMYDRERAPTELTWAQTTIGRLHSQNTSLLFVEAPPVGVSTTSVLGSVPGAKAASQVASTAGTTALPISSVVLAPPVPVLAPPARVVLAPVKAPPAMLASSASPNKWPDAGDRSVQRVFERLDLDQHTCDWLQTLGYVEDLFAKKSCLQHPASSTPDDPPGPERSSSMHVHVLYIATQCPLPGQYYENIPLGSVNRIRIRKVVGGRTSS